MSYIIKKYYLFFVRFIFKVNTKRGIKMQNANPNFKTGIKTLTEIQIKNSLPGYDTLLKNLKQSEKMLQH